MKKSLFLSLLLCLFATSAIAVTNTVNGADYLDLSKLNDEQRAQLALQAAQMSKVVVKEVPKAEVVADVSEKMRNETSKWAELGKNAVVALIAAAKELGIAANDFVQTPVGKMVMFVVIWKFMGVQVLGIVFGLLLIITGCTASVLLWNHLSINRIEYENIPRFNGAWISRKIKSKVPASAEGMFGAVIGSLAPLIIGWIVGLMMILR